MDSWSIKNHSFYNKTQIPFFLVIFSFFFPLETFSTWLWALLFQMYKTTTQMPQISKPSQIVKLFHIPNSTQSAKQHRYNQKQRKKKQKKGKERNGRPTATSGGGGPVSTTTKQAFIVRHLSFSYKGRASCLRIAYAHSETSIGCLLMHLALEKN